MFDKATLKSLKRGDVKNVKGPILALTCMDNKPVQMAGRYSECPADVLSLVEKKMKDGSIESLPCPEIVVDYNKCIGEVDRNDQMKSYYIVRVAGRNWWLRIFFHIAD